MFDRMSEELLNRVTVTLITLLFILLLAIASSNKYVTLHYWCMKETTFLNYL
jgi:preprotein translocase subunit SecG